MAPLAVLGLLFAGVARDAQASLLNDSVTCGGGDFDCTPSSAVVGAGIEFSPIKRGPFFELFSGDVGATDITLTALMNSTIVDPLVLTFGSLDDSSGGVITGVSLVTNVGNLTLSDITHTDHSVSIVVGGTEWHGPESSLDLSEAVIGLTFTAITPEPATLALLASAVGAVAVTRFWRRR